MIFETVVEIKDDLSGNLSGYLVNGNVGVPIDTNNSNYQELMKLVDAGEVVITEV